MGRRVAKGESRMRNWEGRLTVDLLAIDLQYATLQGFVGVPACRSMAGSSVATDGERFTFGYFRNGEVGGFWLSAALGSASGVDLTLFRRIMLRWTANEGDGCVAQPESMEDLEDLESLVARDMHAGRDIRGPIRPT